MSTVLVQAELRMRSRPLEPSAGDPRVGALDRALDQFVGVREIVRRILRADTAAAGRSSRCSPLKAFEFADQLARDQQSQRVQRVRDRADGGAWQRASVSGRQNDRDARRLARPPRGPACCWRCAVREIRDPRNCTGAKAAGIAALARIASAGGAFREHDGLARRMSVATDVDRDLRVFQIAVRQMRVDEAAQAATRYQKIAPAKKPYNDLHVRRKHVLPPQPAPDRRAAHAFEGRFPA